MNGGNHEEISPDRETTSKWNRSNWLAIAARRFMDGASDFQVGREDGPRPLDAEGEGSEEDSSVFGLTLSERLRAVLSYDEQSVSTISNGTYTTDKILLAEAGAAACILALEGPRADDASLAGPAAPKRSFADPMMMIRRHHRDHLDIRRPEEDPDGVNDQMPPAPPALSVVPISSRSAKQQTSTMIHPFQAPVMPNSSPSTEKNVGEAANRRNYGWKIFLWLVIFVSASFAVTFNVVWKRRSHKQRPGPATTTTTTTMATTHTASPEADAFSFAPTSPSVATNTIPSPSISPSATPLSGKKSVSPTAAASLDPSNMPVEEESSTQPSAASSSSPTAAPTTLSEEVLQTLNELVSPKTISLIENNPTSPQALAFDWVVSHVLPPQQQSRWQGPGNPSNRKERILQRFILACLYFSTSGDDWENRNGWLNTETDECTWFNRALPPCNVQGLLVFLDLSDNHLVGSLPEEIGLLGPSLLTLRLERNRLTGQMPTSIRHLGFLYDLDLSYNYFTGSLPEDLGKLEELESFSVKENIELEGPLPMSLSQSPRLKRLDVSRTLLTGSLPFDDCDRVDFMAADCQQVECPCCTICCTGLATTTTEDNECEPVAVR